MIIDVKPAHASFINNIGYNDQTKELSVDIKDKTYIYRDVEKETAASFLFAESKGSFFSKKIKNHYQTLLVIPLKNKKA